MTAGLPPFVTDTVLKRDVFSETRKGHFEGAPDEPVIRRIVTAAPWWSRPLAWALARREIAGLEAVKNIAGAPELIAIDADGLYRRFSEGTPLHLARPDMPEWYRDAARLLRALHRAGVTHNDLAKPQNWLVLADGSAGVIDFQLASRHRRRGRWFRLLAYEDRRHLIKQKRGFAPHLLTPTEKRVLARRSWPSRLWMATGKRLYNAVTRGLIGWSDGEGTGDRIEREGAAVIARLTAHPRVEAAALAVFPLPKKGTGLYAFAELAGHAAPDTLVDAERRALAACGADLVQPVARLPRRADGTPRDDVLKLIAMNQLTELDALVGTDADLAAIARQIASARLNFTDRRLSQLEH